jgi:hypothetical protein
MYTVLRIAGDTGTLEPLLARLREVMPESRPDRRRPGDLVLDFSHAADWVTHQREIETRLEQVAAVLATARAGALRLVLDCALDSPAEHGVFTRSYRFPARILSRLAELGIDLEATLYRTGEA